ncbi:hypothetical protein CYLTODRAFT_452296 [Cylindrobasidium torrendii FP15055 ss-10]|uniref:Uncharacterized protein n=1 Tax=Cylindrobasidium torrendii FP15055 ss-10 TaxID=1314674 RepID=A0A0D7BH42_9AGAR|nr:hypothetical protein CYLTODRAFT_452296 [Cylindrobasidium torrendii FP15055 ss-10]
MSECTFLGIPPSEMAELRCTLNAGCSAVAKRRRANTNTTLSTPKTTPDISAAINASADVYSTQRASMAMDSSSILMTPSYNFDGDGNITMTRLHPSASGIPTTCTIQKPNPNSTLGLPMPKNPFVSPDTAFIEEGVERMMAPIVPLRVSLTAEVEVYDDAYPASTRPRERTTGL